MGEPGGTASRGAGLAKLDRVLVDARGNDEAGGDVVQAQLLAGLAGATGGSAAARGRCDPARSGGRALPGRR